MKISPRYDGLPIIELDGPPAAVREPFLRQRRRLATIAAELTPAQWGADSRCEAWRVQDVLAHLTGTDRYWQRSITAGLAGKPTRLLSGFDPKESPASLVDRSRQLPAAEALDAYTTANETLCAMVEAIGDDDWAVRGESPVGHVELSALLHHALWDSWIHERDILIPLRLPQERQADEILACLRYAAGLSPAFALQTSPTARGTLVLEATDPTAHITIVVDGQVRVAQDGAAGGDLSLSGDAIGLLEAISVRAPWVDDLPEEKAWLVTGLADVFESTPPA